jgi:DNA-binding NarL/FixJ family response regulator
MHPCRKRISPEQQQRCIELLKQGVHYRVIAEQLGLHHSSVGHIAQKAGIRRAKTLASEIPVNAILALHADGLSASKIASQLDITTRTVCKYLRAYNRPVAVGGNKPSVPSETLADLHFKQHLGYLAIGQQLNLSPANVRTRIKRYVKRLEALKAKAVADKTRTRQREHIREKRRLSKIAGE